MNQAPLLFRTRYLRNDFRKKGDDYLIWASELSPFALKLEAMLLYAGLPYRFLPAEGDSLENALIYGRLLLKKRQGAIRRYPGPSQLDEYPLVPYLLANDGHFYFDSTGIAQWLDAQALTGSYPLYPKDGSLRFLALLIEEAFDEFGLYMVHHNRWVHSVKTNDAGKRLAREFAQLLPGVLTKPIGRRFAQRQIRRLPYLFSFADKPMKKRQSFPETHTLLDQAFVQYLDGLEAVLSNQSYLLGNSFTVADAAVYGQLGMNLSDPAAEKMIANRAPLTYQWLNRIAAGEHSDKPEEPDYWLSDSLKALLAIIDATFVDLMGQNREAYQRYKDEPVSHMNESGFNKRKCLYEGALMGYPFKTVVKTFQVRVLDDLQEEWRALSSDDKSKLAHLTQDLTEFNRIF